MSSILPAEIVDIATSSTQSSDTNVKKHLLFGLLLFICLIFSLLVIDSIWIILGLYMVFVPLLFSLSFSIDQATKNRIHSGVLRWASNDITNIQNTYRHYDLDQILYLAQSEINACHKKRNRLLIALILTFLGMIGFLFGESRLPHIWSDILFWSGFGLLIGLEIWWTCLSTEGIRIREYWTIIYDVRQELEKNA